MAGADVCALIVVVIAPASETSHTTRSGYPRTVAGASNRDHGSTEMRGHSRPRHGTGRLWYRLRRSDRHSTGLARAPRCYLHRRGILVSIAHPSPIGRHMAGPGLGPEIGRHFCRLMGGDLTVESIYGLDSTFLVRLPPLVMKPVAASV